MNQFIDFKYIIAIDFEATCVDDKYAISHHKHEIIEFSAVLMNVSSGKIEEEFHQYVRPKENPTLTEDCLNLTGITQSDVNQASTLQIVLREFENWLVLMCQKKNLFLPKMKKPKNSSNLCAFATWSTYDLESYLQIECQRKDFLIPSYLMQWIDMKVIFDKMYPSTLNSKTEIMRSQFPFTYAKQSFENALIQLKIPFEGKQHSGIDDARDLTILIMKLIEIGSILEVTNDLRKGSTHTWLYH